MQSLITKKDHIKLRRDSSVFFDPDYDCYIEEFFHEMLTFERKRSERSGEPFLVMMLDFAGIRNLVKRHQTVKEAVKILSGLIRETDIMGWYRSGVDLCVIFTEMNSLETESLRKKILQDINASFTRELLQAISVHFFRFPGDDGDGNKTKSGFTFYSDLPKIDKARKKALGLKRIMDIFGSLMAILIFSPFFIIIPICIKLTSRGPVFFAQERVGQYGKIFRFLKFRSMYVNNDQNVHKEYVHNLISGKESGASKRGNGSGQKIYKIMNDKRVTPIGKLLRKTSMDELPQFFNVLRGDMSLAGPRPPIPYELDKYFIWHRRRVQEIKPGITGLWQVVGRSSTTFDEMVRLDLQYARNWSLWLDILILLRTPKAVMVGKGAH